MHVSHDRDKRRSEKTKSRKGKGADTDPKEVGFDVNLKFTEKQIHHLILNPKIKSSEQKKIQENPAVKTPNKLGHTYVWSGRPQWDDIFEQSKSYRSPGGLFYIYLCI